MDGLTTRSRRGCHAATPAAAIPGTATGVERVLFPMLPSHPDLAVAARRAPAADVAVAADVVPART